jgi:hypothetical protein
MTKLLNKYQVIGMTISAVALGIASLFFIPHSVEGTYYAGRTVQCLCDCEHFIRIHHGVISIYSVGSHEEAFIGGTYSVRGKTVDELPESFTKTHEHLINFYNIESSSIAGIKISDEKDLFLFRTLPFSKVHSAIQTMELDRIHKDKDFIYRDYFDSDYNLIRETKLPLPNKTLHPTTHRG